MSISHALTQALDRLLGDHDGREPQCQWKCPFCEGKGVNVKNDHRKLSVNTATGQARCFRCDSRFGSATSLLKALGEDDIDQFRYMDRDGEIGFSPYNYLASRFYSRRSQLVNGDKLKPMPMPEGCEPLWPRSTWEDEMYEKPVRYLTRRGVDRCSAKRFELHYTGVGWYKHRIICPIRMFGRIVSFTNRDANRRSAKKTLNAKKRDGYYNTGDCLLGFDRAVGSPRVSIVEGLFDHIGTPSSVATLGKTITEAQIRLLKLLADYGTEEFVVARDSDAEATPTYELIADRLPKVSILSLDAGDPFENRDRMATLLESSTTAASPLQKITQRINAMRNRKK